MAQDADPAKVIGQMRMNDAVKYFSDLKKRFWIEKKAAPYGGSLRLGQVWEGTDNQTRVGKQGILLSVFAGPVSASRRAPTRDDFDRELRRLYPYDYGDYAKHLTKKPPFRPTGPTSPSSRPVTGRPTLGRSSESAKSSASRSTTGCSSPENTRRWTSSGTWRAHCARENARQRHCC